MAGQAEITPKFVGVASATSRRAGAGSHPCQGLFWAAPGGGPRAGVIATHYNVDFSEHYLAQPLARRSLAFLGWNTRFRGAEDLFVLEHALIDIAAGVRWLREQGGVETVVLLGNSGGGSLMGAYQAAAEGERFWTDLGGAASDALSGLPPADLYVALNAHPGRPEVLTAWLDPAVLDEADPVATDPDLDAFAQPAPFDLAFVDRYRSAQTARNHRITAWARAELARLGAAGFPDRIFPLFRTWADLRFLDASLDPSDRPSPACYAGDPSRANRGPFGIGRANTLRAWLSMWSLEASACRGAPRLAHVTRPALVIQSLADVGVFPSDAQAIHTALASADKRLEFVKGAHYFEDDPNNLDEVADLIAGWILERA